MNSRPIGGVALLLLMSSCVSSCVALPAVLTSRSADGPRESIYVIRHGPHVGLILPTTPVPRSVWPEIHQVHADFVEVGWADRFYSLSRAPEACRVSVALLLPTASVLKVMPVDTHPTNYFTGNGLVRINVSTQGFQRICGFVADTYARDANGRASVLAVTTGCTIYAARGRYCLFKNSNGWTAQALREGGCAISPIRCVSASQTFSHAAECGMIVREAVGLDRVPVMAADPAR